MKITNYTVLEAVFLNTLEQDVQEAIRSGLQPFGSLIIHENGYAQVVVKYEEED